MRVKRRLTESDIPTSSNWLGALRIYLAVSIVGHLIWEVIQLPLYTIWSTASLGELTFAVLHCTGGDTLIALSTLTSALVLTGVSAWPSHRFGWVCVLTVGLGIGYTVFSEWLNAGVRASWTYSDWMLTLPWVGTGLIQNREGDINSWKTLGRLADDNVMLHFAAGSDRLYAVTQRNDILLSEDGGRIWRSYANTGRSLQKP